MDQVEIDRLRNMDFDEIAEEIALLRAQVERARDALSELHTVVKGECPSLLNEDSGGDARLDLEIREILSASSTGGK